MTTAKIPVRNDLSHALLPTSRRIPRFVCTHYCYGPIRLSTRFKEFGREGKKLGTEQSPGLWVYSENLQKCRVLARSDQIRRKTKRIWFWERGVLRENRWRFPPAKFLPPQDSQQSAKIERNCSVSCVHPHRLNGSTASRKRPRQMSSNTQSILYGLLLGERSVKRGQTIRRDWDVKVRRDGEIVESC